MTTGVVVIALDLSQPAAVLPSARKWLALVSDRLGGTFERLEKRGSKLPEQLRLRAKKVLFGGHEDADQVQPLGVRGVRGCWELPAICNPSSGCLRAACWT